MRYTRKQIDSMEQDLDAAIGVYLHERGWVCISDMPDHVWRWTKDINGRTFAVDKTQARLLQERLDFDSGADHGDESDAAERREAKER